MKSPGHSALCQGARNQCHHPNTQEGQRATRWISWDGQALGFTNFPVPLWPSAWAAAGWHHPNTSPGRGAAGWGGTSTEQCVETPIGPRAERLSQNTVIKPLVSQQTKAQHINQPSTSGHATSEASRSTPLPWPRSVLWGPEDARCPWGLCHRHEGRHPVPWRYPIPLGAGTCFSPSARLLLIGSSLISPTLCGGNKQQLEKRAGFSLPGSLPAAAPTRARRCPAARRLFPRAGRAAPSSLVLFLPLPAWDAAGCPAPACSPCLTSRGKGTFPARQKVSVLKESAGAVFINQKRCKGSVLINIIIPFGGGSPHLTSQRLSELKMGAVTRSPVSQGGALPCPAEPPGHTRSPTAGRAGTAFSIQTSFI